MAHGVRDLRIWQDAVGVAGEVIRTVRPVARREIKAFTDLLLIAAPRAALAIGDAHARLSAADERESYLRAKRALVELETLLSVAWQAGVLPAGAHSQLSTKIGALAQRLTSYVTFVERQVAADPAPRIDEAAWQTAGGTR